MKTKVRFKALRRGAVVRRTLLIEHPDFNVVPSEIFNGYELPPIPIESQVIDYLDSIDKSDIMVQNDWDMILDYYPYHKRNHRNEIKEFITFMQPYVDMFPELQRPFEAVMSEAKDVLFGRRKSNETKAKELLKMVDMSLRASRGTLESCTRLMRGELKTLKEQLL